MCRISILYCAKAATLLLSLELVLGEEHEPVGVIISLGDGKISVACCIISCNVCFWRELGTEGEGALSKHWEPSATVRSNTVWDPCCTMWESSHLLSMLSITQGRKLH